MMHRSGRFLTLTIAFSLGLGAIAFFKYEAYREKNRQTEATELTQALEDAEQFLRSRHPLRALEILDETETKLTSYPALNAQWKQLLLETAVTLEDDEILYKLWLKDPSIFLDHEKLSLKVASQALTLKNLDHYKQIAYPWHAHGKEGQNWFLLEADALVLQGESEKAIAFLHVASLQGNQEVLRLIRLALLNEKEHPKVAWHYLLKALKINPNDPDLHLYRAELLESTKNKELAIQEYQTAAEKGRTNAFYTEELVNFFLRQHQYKEALSLIDVTTLPSDPLRLKALFLDRVYLGKGTKEFWNGERLAGPEAEWLKVLQDLKVGQEKRAYNTLQNHPEMADLNPPLYDGLKKGIAKRHPYLKEEETLILAHPSHPVFAHLSDDEMPKEYRALIQSPDFYAALALASGWFEAALNLRHSDTLSPEFPRWVAYGFAKALVSNRSKEEALLFIQKQTPTPQLYLLAGELHLQLGKYKEAERILSALAQNPSTIGAQAALTLSKTYAAQGSFLKARDAVLANQSLADSIAGKEALARLELKFGHPDLAESMYREISAQSTEAQSFLAKKAYEGKDYETAYQLTKHLVDQFPERKDLKVQLNKIHQAMKS